MFENYPNETYFENMCFAKKMILFMWNAKLSSYHRH